MKSKIISKIINAVGTNPSFKVMNKIRNFVKDDLKKADKGDIKLALGGGSLLGLAQLLKSIEGKKDGGEIKIKEKPLSPRQKALIDSANRIRKLEAAEERTKGITPKVKPKKPIVPKKKPINSKALAKKYFTGVF